MRNWRRKLDVSDVFRGDDATWPERRATMVRRIRKLDPNDHDGELQSIADELGDAEDGDEWDGPWDLFYDWADANDVWVVTR